MGTCGIGVFEGVTLLGSEIIVTGGPGVKRYSGVGSGTLLTSNVSEPWAIVADSDFVWFTSRAKGGVFRISQVSMNQDADEITQTFGQSRGALAADDMHLYWTLSNGSIVKMLKDGSAAQQIASAQSFDATNLTPQFFAVDTAHLFWSTVNGRIMRIEKDGSKLVVLASNQSDPAGIALDPGDTGSVYWVNRAEGTIRSVGKDGVGLKTLAAGQDHPIAITVDDTDVYWATQSGDVLRIAK
jgi:sugar lactone lactonase YvrE